MYNTSNVYLTIYTIHFRTYNTRPKTPNCNKSVDILEQLVTSRYQNGFAWLATAFDNKSVASC